MSSNHRESLGVVGGERIVLNQNHHNNNNITTNNNNYYHHHHQQQYCHQHYGHSKGSTTSSPNNKENSSTGMLLEKNSPMGSPEIGDCEKTTAAAAATTTTTTEKTPVKSRLGYSSPPLETPPPKSPVSFSVMHHKTPTATPLHRYNNQAHQTKTPIGSSKVLRKHFQRMALSSTSDNNNSNSSSSNNNNIGGITNNTNHTHHYHHHYPYSATTTPRNKIRATSATCSVGHKKGGRRLLESGAVRLTPSTANKTISKRRVGYDGTFYTPSKQLLRPTISTRQSSRKPSLNSFSSTSVVPAAAATTATFINTTTTTTTTATTNNTNSASACNIATKETVVSFAGLPSQIETETSIDDDNCTLASMDEISMECIGYYQQDDDDHRLQNQRYHHHHQQQQLNLPPAPSNRKACADPVAMTLLNDGRENLHYLLRQDTSKEGKHHVVDVLGETSVADARADADADDSLSTQSGTSSSTNYTNRSSPAKVSSQLLFHPTIQLARPVARVASIKAREAIDYALSSVKKKNSSLSTPTAPRTTATPTPTPTPTPIKLPSSFSPSPPTAK